MRLTGMVKGIFTQGGHARESGRRKSPTEAEKGFRIPDTEEKREISLQFFNVLLQKIGQ